ncbi:hypothetical protein [Actinacidiphila alni]|uniref:Uncharacterized protein n=1 Tax=Actinacidiphila alni TaxID=380248 RepID=A0A1I2KN14_9ACTN|nr:hypothetical protein [Actinacidiphila alni]SFF67719.1 hypothetical protein SAMN05216251_1245 [Actinacidiphila alni]
MAFSADELRVLRRALAEALYSGQAAADSGFAPRPAEHVREYLRLVDAVDEAAAEAGRLRSFLLDELGRYRQALPGAAGGYLERLTAALATGYVPGADDLAALRGLRALPCASPEHRRRTALLRRCEILAENDVRLRLEAHMTTSRRLLTLPGARTAAESAAAEPAEKKPAPAPSPAPASPAGPGSPAPAAPKRPPTPAEIWPPHRKPAAPKPPGEARSA